MKRQIKSLRFEAKEGLKRWQSRSASMAAGLTDHVWTTKELIRSVAIPKSNNA